MGYLSDKKRVAWLSVGSNSFLTLGKLRGELRVEAELFLDPEVNLAESRSLSEKLRHRLETCFPEISETILSLHAVKGWRGAIHKDDMERVARIVGEQQSRFAGIHGLEVASSRGVHRVRLSLGVPHALPVAEAHTVGHKLESQIRGLFPEGAEITIHLEPCDENCASCHVTCPIRKKESKQ